MKGHFAALALGGILAACAGSPATATHQVARPETQSVARAETGTIQWIGGPTAFLERAGLRVITDPMLGPRGPNAFVLPKHPSTGQPNASIERYLAPAPYTLDGLDAILISHTHNDHVDARAKELLPKQLPVVVAKAGEAALREAGFRDVRGLDWGESTTIGAGGATLRVLAVAAHHAHDPDLDREVGKGNGYVLEWKDTRGTYRVYWTGDAVLSDETKEFTALYGSVDLLLPHMGGVGGDGGLGLRTMNAEEALELVKRVNPKRVMPIHHTTFGHYREPIDALEQRAAELGEAGRFEFLRLGRATAL
ncbi:MAG TPA: MBL fold metallo-hydrolase [Polyangiales bacterium]|nr:MBL fold metallo-hydrolase [Polyangiales bacterium]